MHETVAVPVPVTLDGVTELQVNPDGTESVRVTVPVKPFRAVIAIVDCAEAPTGVAEGVDAAKVKSDTE